MKKTNLYCGSYTVEASLLMGILLPLLASILYMGFYLHDRSFLQGAAHEAAAYASLRADDESADTAQAAQKLVSGRMLGTRGVSAKTSADQKKVQIHYQGNFQTPGMIAAFWGSGASVVSARAALTLERPSKRIQTIRGVAKVFNSIRRTRE